MDQKVRGFSDSRILGGINPRKIRFLNIDSNMIAINTAQAIAFTSGIPRGDVK
jgi:hypothetical protein